MSTRAGRPSSPASSLIPRECLRSPRRGASPFHGHAFEPGDWFVFGSETAGLPADVLANFDGAQRVRLPMRVGNRSLNLSNTVAVVVYEAWRQHGFAGGE